MPAAKNLHFILLLALFFTAGVNTFAQDRCGTDEYVKTIQPTQTRAQFEDWIRNLRKIRASETGRTGSNSYRIPVVVHVIHNGQSHETNIPDAQILSQIRVLNEDFKRLNADAANTPAVFVPVAGSLDIEFILAKQTPEGTETNGIVRVEGAKSEWKIADQVQLKQTSYWPSDQYLNIWVCNETDYLGYAQFPETDLLPGLETASRNANTDGVVINYRVFGSIDDGNFNLQPAYNKGRTATHEVGHYFGLRHIWGDDEGSCGNDGDYVADTPDQGDRTLNCPSHPRLTCSSVTSMFQNYLDYTNDGCMNLFTAGQVGRMQVILDNSPRRKTLSSSPGLDEPVAVPNDLGIREVLAPGAGACAGNLTPRITVRNYGDNTITSFSVSISKDGTFLEELDFTTSLLPLEATEITFSTVQMVTGPTDFTFEITQTNGGPDGKSQNDVISVNTVVPENAPLPLVETISIEPPGKWDIVNPDGNKTWAFGIAPSSTPDNGAMKMDFYDYEDSEGEIDLFISPLLDFSTAPQAILLFDVSYAQYLDSEDGLRVLVVKNCNTDLAAAETVYLKSGSTLKTTSKKDDAYTPASAADWRTETLDLTPYVGEPAVQIAFVGVNDWGNNLYIDNIKVTTDIFKNIAIEDLVSPPQVTCSATLFPKLRLRNVGTTSNTLEIEYSINGTANTETITVDNFASGSELDVTLTQAINLTAGENTLVFSVKSVDGLDDVDPSNNTITRKVIYSPTSLPVPFRETFESDSPWISINPVGNASWLESDLSGNNSRVYQGFSNTVVGDEAWLVSPVLDLTKVSEASLRFFTSYRLGPYDSEILELRASVGCETPFETTLATWSGNNLESESSDASWSPSSKDDYSEKIININSVTGSADVRLAFVVINNNTNNLYIDDIEFFLSDFPADVDVDGSFAVYPNPARAGDDISIIFRLPETSEVAVEIIDSMGKSIQRFNAENILNQVLPLDLTDNGPGVYVVRVITPTRTYSSKLVYIN